MTQEQKELLLKDLCARLPYGVKCSHKNEGIFSLTCIDLEYNYIYVKHGGFKIGEPEINHKHIKPYLFPLSSMTEEQWIDTPYANLNKFTFDSFKCGCSTLAFETYEVNLSYVVEFINWCYKNHFDIHGLIPKGLAIDATGKNIY